MKKFTTLIAAAAVFSSAPALANETCYIQVENLLKDKAKLPPADVKASLEVKAAETGSVLSAAQVAAPNFEPAIAVDCRPTLAANIVAYAGLGPQANLPVPKKAAPIAAPTPPSGEVAVSKAKAAAKQANADKLAAQRALATIRAQPVIRPAELNNAAQRLAVATEAYNSAKGELVAIKDAAEAAAAAAELFKQQSEGNAGAAKLSEEGAKSWAEVSKQYALQVKATAEKLTLFNMLMAAVLALLSLAVVWLFWSKASNKRVRKVEQKVTNVVAELKGIKIPAHLEDHLANLSAGENKEFEFVIAGQELLVKFTKATRKLGFKRSRVTTEDIKEQTQPMPIDTLREKLLGHISAGRLTAETVKQGKNIHTMHKEAA